MALDKDDVKSRVIEIATSLIAKHGSAGLQARTIAKEAGISVGSIYNLVGDMDALHRIVNAQLLDELGVAGTGTVAELDKRGETDLTTRLLELSHAYLGFVTENRTAWNALLAFNRSATVDETPDWYFVRLEMLFDVIADELRATELGSDEQKLAIAARALWSAVHGIVTNAYVGEDKRQLVETIRMQIDILIRTFVRGLRA